MTTELDQLFADQSATRNYLEELVGENKKFKTNDDLARGKAESDAFILKLQGELDGLRKDLTASTKLEQLLEKLQNTPPGGNTPSGESEGNDSAPKLDDHAIEQLVEKKLQDYERTNRTQTNVNAVKEQLLEVLGKDNFGTKLKDRILALGLTEKQYLDLASTSPQAAIKLIAGERQQTQTYSIPSSSVSTERFVPSNGADRNFAFYEKLRKDNKSDYWSPKVQSQMHKDAQRLGEKFYA